MNNKEILNELINNQLVKYSAKGIIIGKDWFFNTISYDSIIYNNYNTIEELTKAINEGIKDNSIDSGMGFSNIYGCMMMITIERTIIINDKPYTNIEIEDIIFGDIPDIYMDFLETSYYNSIN